ncbi:hypothetical protein KNP414_04690 [Paenibacillus mucilaginosus KNP414]|uniref:Uncharacterized protein n=1 Tax=Paenibacillus mucilaginosus (strain KNP414) TaxID=1036673 RepID=F8FE20_PAEMK|nr:hypothetical protein KNP414_04690 [Paenibacillus mucilaginosus KNP414]
MKETAGAPSVLAAAEQVYPAQRSAILIEKRQAAKGREENL